MVSEYKKAIIEMASNDIYKLAITFSFNVDVVNTGFNIDTVKKKISDFNCRFFREYYNKWNWYKKIKVSSIHFVEHQNSYIHSHSIYSIPNKQDIKNLDIIDTNWVCKYKELAEKCFNKVWYNGDIFLTPITSNGYANYITKEVSNYVNDTDDFFLL